MKDVLLKIKPGRPEHIKGGDTCLAHPGSQELLFKHPTLTSQVLMLAPTLYIGAYIYMHTCVHTHKYKYSSQNIIIYTGTDKHRDTHLVNNIYLLTDYLVRTEKYQARSYIVRTERSEVRAT